MDADDPVQIIVGSKNTGVVQFQNCAFWGPSNQIARLEGGAASFVQCNFHFWDRENKGLPAIEARKGSVIVQNCIFHQPFKHIFLGAGVEAGVISGNLMKGEVRIENQSPNAIQINNNSSMK